MSSISGLLCQVWITMGLISVKWDQSWVFIGRTDAKAETPVLWPPHEKSWLIEKDPNAGRGWRQKEKGTTEDEMAGWHHLLDEHEFEWTLGVDDEQGGLACCDHGITKSWTRLSNWTELNLTGILSCSSFCTHETVQGFKQSSNFQATLVAFYLLHFTFTPDTLSLVLLLATVHSAVVEDWDNPSTFYCWFLLLFNWRSRQWLQPWKAIALLLLQGWYFVL